MRVHLAPVYITTKDYEPVVFGHVFRCVSENITDDAHRWLGWVDEGIPHHELFENIVLDGALEEVLLYALIFGCSYVPGALAQVEENITIISRRSHEACVMPSVQQQYVQLYPSTLLSL